MSSSSIRCCVDIINSSSFQSSVLVRNCCVGLESLGGGDTEGMFRGLWLKLRESSRIARAFPSAFGGEDCIVGGCGCCSRESAWDVSEDGTIRVGAIRGVRKDMFPMYNGRGIEVSKNAVQAAANGQTESKLGRAMVNWRLETDAMWRITSDVNSADHRR